MSVAASSWAWKQIEAGRVRQPGTRLVLLALADRADDNGVCYPGQASLSRKTGQTKRSVQRGIDSLTGSGLLVYQRRWADSGDYDTNLYQLLMPNVEPVIAVDSEGGDNLSLPLPGLEAPRGGGDKMSPRGDDAGVARGGDTMSTNTSLDTSVKRPAPEAAPGLHGRLFDALAEACAWRLDQLTKTARARLGSAARELVALDPQMDPAEVGRRAARYRAMFPNAAVTPQALTGNWALLGPPAPRSGPSPAARAASDADFERRRREGEARSLFYLLGEPSSLVRRPGEAAGDWCARLEAALSAKSNGRGNAATANP